MESAVAGPSRHRDATKARRDQRPAPYSVSQTARLPAVQLQDLQGGPQVQGGFGMIQGQKEELARIRTNCLPPRSAATLKLWRAELRELEVFVKAFYPHRQTKELVLDEEYFEMMQDFVTAKVKRAISKGRKLRYTTLLNVGGSLLGITRYMAVGSTEIDVARLRRDLETLRSQLVREFDLPKDRGRERAQIGTGEIRVMLEALFQDVWDWDANIQDAVLVLLFHYTGFRPGTVLPSSVYDDSHALKWEELRFTLHYNDDGTFKGVDLEVRATHFKGKMNQDKMSRRQTYFIRSSAGSTPNLLFDLPALALVHGLRGKIFEETLDEMINAKRASPKLKAAAKSLPVFAKKAKRGLGLERGGGQAFTAAAGNKLIKALAQKAGLVYDEATSSGFTIYSIRHATATAWVRSFGVETAKKLMGHAPDSSTLLDVYWHPIPDLMHAFADDVPLLAQPAMGAALHNSDPEASTLYSRYRAAISKDLTCRAFVRDLAMLNDCARLDSDAWLRVEPYASLAKGSAAPTIDEQITNLTRALRRRQWKIQHDLAQSNAAERYESLQEAEYARLTEHYARLKSNSNPFCRDLLKYLRDASSTLDPHAPQEPPMNMSSHLPTIPSDLPAEIASRMRESVIKALKDGSISDEDMGEDDTALEEDIASFFSAGADVILEEIEGEEQDDPADAISIEPEAAESRPAHRNVEADEAAQCDLPELRAPRASPAPQVDPAAGTSTEIATVLQWVTTLTSAVKPRFEKRACADCQADSAFAPQYLKEKTYLATHLSGHRLGDFHSAEKTAWRKIYLEIEAQSDASLFNEIMRARVQTIATANYTCQLCKTRFRVHKERLEKLHREHLVQDHGIRPPPAAESDVIAGGRFLTDAAEYVFNGLCRELEVLGFGAEEFNHGAFDFDEELEDAKVDLGQHFQLLEELREGLKEAGVMDGLFEC